MITLLLACSIEYRSDMVGKNDIYSAISARSESKRIVIVAYDGVQALDITGPSSVFARANDFVPQAYEVVHASPNGGQVRSQCGIVISELVCFDEIGPATDTILVAGGSEDALSAVIFDSGLLNWLKVMAPKTRRIGSVCTGAFILAACGLLDNRRAVTHWASCARLAQLWPSIKVDANAIYMRDGHIFTSAGVTAAIDAALALVEEDLGRAVAAQIAKSMVLFLRRSGGQSQYSNALAAQSKASDKFADLINWITDNLREDLSIPVLARQASMSERNFMRKFQHEINMTPAAYVRSARLEAACDWLESTSWPVKRIAALAGFGSSDSLERAIRKRFDTTPSALRHAFGAT